MVAILNRDGYGVYFKTGRAVSSDRIRQVRADLRERLRALDACLVENSGVELLLPVRDPPRIIEAFVDQAWRETEWGEEELPPTEVAGLFQRLTALAEIEIVYIAPARVSGLLEALPGRPEGELRTAWEETVGSLGPLAARLDRDGSFFMSWRA